MKIFVVISGVRALETSRQLPEEELEDVTELILSVGRIGRVEPEQVGETACGIGLYAAVLVEEN